VCVSSRWIELIHSLCDMLIGATGDWFLHLVASPRSTRASISLWPHFRGVGRLDNSGDEGISLATNCYIRTILTHDIHRSFQGNSTSTTPNDGLLAPCNQNLGLGASTLENITARNANGSLQSRIQVLQTNLSPRRHYTARRMVSCTPDFTATSAALIRVHVSRRRR
jgi:hypothetical protein